MDGWRGGRGYYKERCGVRNGWEGMFYAESGRVKEMQYKSRERRGVLNEGNDVEAKDEELDGRETVKVFLWKDRKDEVK